MYVHYLINNINDGILKFDHRVFFRVPMRQKLKTTNI